MDDDLFSTLHIPWLVLALLILVMLSAFFSGSETSLMSLNIYRLKHLAKTNNRAKLIVKLLLRPDRLLGVLLIGNNFVNISASAIATIIGMRLLGDVGVLISTVTLTIVLLIFGEILPKTLGALKSKTMSLIIVWPVQYLLWLLYPFVWFVNALSNSVLWCFGVNTHRRHEALSLEELRTVVTEASGLISERHKDMLASILDLDKLTVNSVMTPRTEIVGIDLAESTEVIMQRLTSSQHTLLPVYREELENVIGIIHMRDVPKVIAAGSGNLPSLDLTDICVKPYFVPEGTSLHKQLINFQHNKKRIALVVDEYGDILGLITLADILEEIVGEFTTDVITENQTIIPQPEGSFLVDGSINIRALNRTMGWELPTGEAKTLSGLITEYLEAIPEAKTGLMIAGYPIEVVKVEDNMVKFAKIYMRVAH